MITKPDFLATLPSHEELAAAFNAAASTNAAVKAIREAYRTNVMFSIAGHVANFNRTCTEPLEGQMLWHLVNELRPSTVIEVGFGCGASAAFLLAGLAPNNGRLISIDADVSWAEGTGHYYLRHLKLAQFHTLIEERSDIVLPDLIAHEEIPVPLTLSFIDGAHFFDSALMDFIFLDRMTAIGGIIAFDDAAWPALRTVASYIAHNFPYRLHYATSRLLLCHKLDSLEKRASTHFKPFQCSINTDYDVHTTRADAAAVPGVTFSETSKTDRLSLNG